MITSQNMQELLLILCTPHSPLAPLDLSVLIVLPGDQLHKSSTHNLCVTWAFPLCSHQTPREFLCGFGVLLEKIWTPVDFWKLGDGQQESGETIQGGKHGEWNSRWDYARVFGEHFKICNTSCKLSKSLQDLQHTLEVLLVILSYSIH